MKTAILFLVLAFSVPAWSQTTSPSRKPLNLEKGVAIQGYDPVAYFQQKALKGNKAIAAQHGGATYYFATEAHRAEFLKNPTRYEPQYGGWCAYAMGATGEKVPIDPKTFKILDGKLYLFYNAYFNNTLVSWNKDEAQLKKQADAHWAQLAP